MRLLSRIIVVVVCLQLLLIFGSWIANAYGFEVQSLLSASGIRWTFGKMIGQTASSYLVWLLVIAFTYGVVRKANFNLHASDYRNRLAWRAVITMTILFIACIIMLAFVPHAVLRSVTGELFPSPFATSLVPFAAFFVLLTSVIYGCIVNSFKCISDVIFAMCNGITTFSPLIILYLLIADFVCSLLYVFVA